MFNNDINNCGKVPLLITLTFIYPPNILNVIAAGNRSKPGGVFQEIDHFYQLRFGTIAASDISEFHLQWRQHVRFLKHP